MIVAELDIVGIAIFEPKADAPLIVDSDRMLPRAVAFERMEPVAGRYPQVGEHDRNMDSFQLAQGASSDVWRDPLRLPGPVQFFGLPIREGFDHAGMYRVT